MGAAVIIPTTLFIVYCETRKKSSKKEDLEEEILEPEGEGV